MQNDTHILFVEVKVIDAMYSLDDYITSKKRSAMKRAIQIFLWRSRIDLHPRVDIVFVK
jgi:Holliday junction resolvase-like predicted endonuclease